MTNRFLYSNIFRKKYLDKLEYFAKSNKEYCHYTTTQALFSMLDSEEFWLRNVQLMNDIDEVAIGFRIFRNKFSSCVDAEVLAEVVREKGGDKWGGRSFIFGEEVFEKNLKAILDDCFVFSMSEIDKNDCDGSLSMWRGYGGTSSVCLVLNKDIIISENNDVRAFVSPVEYINSKVMLEEVEYLLKEAVAWVRRSSSERIPEVLDDLAKAAIGAAMSWKHYGFREELEWRIISSQFFGTEDNRQELPTDSYLINDIPQIVRKLPQRKWDSGFSTEASSVIRRVIIGPCENSNIVREAIVAKMSDCGFENASEVVQLSSIPYRHR